MWKHYTASLFQQLSVLFLVQVHKKAPKGPRKRKRKSQGKALKNAIKAAARTLPINDFLHSHTTLLGDTVDRNIYRYTTRMTFASVCTSFSFPETAQPARACIYLPLHTFEYNREKLPSIFHYGRWRF